MCDGFTNALVIYFQVFLLCKISKKQAPSYSPVFVTVIDQMILISTGLTLRRAP